MKQLFLSVFLCSLIMSVNASTKKELLKECSSTREFVTSLEYLKDNKDFAVKSRDAFRVAEHVATGCTGAARRFIKVVTLLSRATVDSASAIKIGKLFAVHSDHLTNNFVELFKTSYLKNYLDLDVNRSIKIALSLSSDLEDDVSNNTVSDFKKVAKFCMNNDLALGYQVCSELAKRVALKGVRFSKRLGKKFINIYNFLAGSRGPNYSVGRTLKLAEEIITFGPSSPQNFKLAYKYAQQDRGLHLTKPEAVRFGLKMSFLSYTKSETKK